MRIEKDFEELLRLLNQNRVKYCVVGAYAVAFYARPRYTKDIDILIEPSAENAKKLLKSLLDFGFESLKLREDDFVKKGVIVQLGYEPVRIDIITSLKGINFNEVWKTKTAGRYGKVKIFFIGEKELIKCKKLSHRKQDIADLELLQDRL